MRASRPQRVISGVSGLASGCTWCRRKGTAGGALSVPGGRETSHRGVAYQTARPGRHSGQLPPGVLKKGPDGTAQPAKWRAARYARQGQYAQGQYPSRAVHFEGSTLYA
jgi:hypothetical protein